MKKTLFKLMLVTSLTVAGSLSVHGLIPDDADGDGVADSVDACPAEDASGFDRDGDGCIDDFIGARHIEYWGVADDTITYVINSTAAPNINDGSDITAVRNAVEAWPAISNTELTVVYGGTVPQANAAALDRVNLVTFIDQAYNFSNLVLAVGLSTSFESDTLIDGRVWRKGEIYDADMLFNPSKLFKTGGSGPGTDIQGVASHEAGHLFGLSHSAIRSSTMFYVLPGGTAARSLETDDELVYFKAYGDSIALAGANRIEGTVTNGTTSLPVPGAIVFVIASAGGDTAGCDYTLEDGSFSFPGLDDGSYYVAIHPLNGTSPIGFIQPGNINALVADVAQTNFNPEWYDAAESNNDDPNARTAVTVNGGGPVAAVNIITNVDVMSPAVVDAKPADNATGVPVDGAYVIEFSEAIEIGTIQAAFSFRDANTQAAKGGNIAIIRDDSVIVFTPSPPLEFNKAYTLTIDTDMEDKAGNPLVATFTLHVTTELEPPLAITSLAPNKGVVGNTVVVNGAGFDTEPFPIVKFGNIPATVSSATEGSIVVTVPFEATTGPVTVTNADLTVSNSVTFTVLSEFEVARGFESGQVLFDSEPRAVTVVPSGDHAYVATGDGAHSIVVNPALLGYLTRDEIPYPGGLDDVATTPPGTRVYGVSAASGELVEIDSDPADGLLFNEVLSSHAIGAIPNGIVIEPKGRRAYISTDEAEVQVWDVELGSLTFREQVGLMPSPGGASLEGAMAVTPAGDRLLALTDGGSLLFYDLAAETLLTQLTVGADPRGLIVDPAGERAYVSHADGSISVVNLAGAPFQVQDIGTGGSQRGLAITPAGFYIYAADRETDALEIIDLDPTHPTFRSKVADIAAPVNPVDVELSPDGVYAFSLLQGDGTAQNPARMLVTTIGLGPTIKSIYPPAGRIGAKVVISGEGFGDFGLQEGNIVDFNGVSVGAVTSNPTEIIVTVPQGVTTGPVKVRKTYLYFPSPSPQSSNEVLFQVLDAPNTSLMRFAGSIESAFGLTFQDEMAINPTGETILVGASDGSLLIYDIRPGSPTFHKLIRRVDQLGGFAVKDIGVSADGKAAFVASQFEIVVANVNPNDTNFGAVLATFNTSSAGIDRVETSPNNRFVLVGDNEVSQVFLFDAAGVSDGVLPTVAAAIPVDPSYAVDLVFHPTALSAQIATANPNRILTINTDPTTAEFGLITQIITIPGAPSETPVSLAWLPDGSRMMALTLQLTGPNARSLREYAPIGLTGLTEFRVNTLESNIQNAYQEKIHISPRRDVGVRPSSGQGFYYFYVGGLDDAATPATINILGPFQTTLAGNESEFSPDGSRVYMASQFDDAIRVYDFVPADALTIASGNNQNGVVGQFLAAPLRVRVVGTLTGVSYGGVPVTFEVASGGGTFPGDSTIINTSTDTNGFVEIQWRLGPALGAQTVQVSAEGLTGSPVTFTADASPDPETLPLSVSEVIPLDGSVNVGINTAMLVTFSRAVDPASISGASLFVQVAADATLVPVEVGFTDGNRKVSMTPLLPLTPSTAYDIVTTAGIQAAGGGPLTNPGETTFNTQAPPPLSLASISPPSALVGVTVTLAGTGFNPNPAGNVVSFNGVTATPISGNASQLLVKVPVAAVPGPVTVTANAQTSNALNFTVLVPNTTPIDDVIATVGTGSGAKSCAVTPDGALVYAVSPDGDVVIPVDVEGQTTYSSIPVGDQPLAIVIHPDGSFAYVANFSSGTVSVIGAAPTIPTSIRSSRPSTSAAIRPTWRYSPTATACWSPTRARAI